MASSDTVQVDVSLRLTPKQAERLIALIDRVEAGNWRPLSMTFLTPGGNVEHARVYDIDGYCAD